MHRPHQMHLVGGYLFSRFPLVPSTFSLLCGKDTSVPSARMLRGNVFRILQYYLYHQCWLKGHILFYTSVWWALVQVETTSQSARRNNRKLISQGFPAKWLIFTGVIFFSAFLNAQYFSFHPYYEFYVTNLTLRQLSTNQIVPDERYVHGHLYVTTTIINDTKHVTIMFWIILIICTLILHSNRQTLPLHIAV